MSEPTYGPATERMYARLPEFYRDADAEQTWDYPFKRFISAGTQGLDDAETLITRLDPATNTGTSDLADPLTADLAWLPWLAQLVGVRIEPSFSEAERRDAVRFASSGFRAGTKEALVNAAKTALTGTKTATIHDHTSETSEIGAATVWDVLIVTRGDETPDVDLVRDTVIARNAKPAGVMLHFRTYQTDWDTLEALHPTWDDWETTGTWTRIEESGL